MGQTALVRNELAHLGAAEIQLISGFPNIRFRHVTSPLAPEATWSQFFSQLNQNPSQIGGALGNNIVRQQIAFNSVAPAASGIDLSATPSGDGVDLHYESIGKRTLGKGEALQLEVATKDAEYRRIVEWIVPDTHDAYGNRVDPRGRNNNEEGVGEPWDALQFRNPLPMPMTTGPATITADGKFNGQTISYWVNRGELNTLKVTKALSVRALAIENEKQGGRDGVYVGGRHYVQVDVEGRLSINNHRAEAVDLVIRRRFSGDLLRADGDPQASLLEEGAFSVNRRNELIWKIRLEPGKAKDLKYEYRLLVRR